MFGPDICGSTTRKVHVIFEHEGKNHLVKKEIPCETDEFTHLYTLIVRPDNTFEVNIITYLISLFMHNSIIISLIQLLNLK
jgi:calreticulin